MNPNDKQVGGQHYRNAKYQHWDFMIDTYGPDYLVMQCTKYLARYRYAGKAAADLNKVLHYEEKLISLYAVGGKYEHALPNQVPDLKHFARFATAQNIAGDLAGIFQLLMGYTTAKELALAFAMTQKLRNNLRG